MIRAFVEGMIPPASPRTNRLRQPTSAPAGGRWLWRTPPWLWIRRLGRPRGRAVVEVGFRGRGPVVVVVVVVIVVDPMRRRRRRFATWPTSSHAPIAQHEQPRDDRRDPVVELRRDDPAQADDDRGQDEDPQGVGDGHAQAEGHGMDRRAAGADEVGPHQRLAVTGGEGVAGAEGHRGQERADEHDRGEIPLLEQARDLAADPARDGAAGAAAAVARRPGRRRRPRQLPTSRPARRRSGPHRPGRRVERRCAGQRRGIRDRERREDGSTR